MFFTFRQVLLSKHLMLCLMPVSEQKQITLILVEVINVQSELFVFLLTDRFVFFIEADVLRFMLDQDLRCKQANIVSITGLGFHSTAPGKFQYTLYSMLIYMYTGF
jgi:hypothetical protein